MPPSKAGHGCRHGAGPLGVIAAQRAALDEEDVAVVVYEGREVHGVVPKGNTVVPCTVACLEVMLGRRIA